jgi:hypothetical protein
MFVVHKVSKISMMCAPSLRSNIPQTALVATLDTYYFTIRIV